NVEDGGQAPNDELSTPHVFMFPPSTSFWEREKLRAPRRHARHAGVATLPRVASRAGSSRRTAAAVASPERTAPSMYPFHTGEHSVPAQWIRPMGSVSASP